MAVGLAWRRVTARAATASIATGLLLNLGLEFLAKQSWLPALPRPPLPAGVLPGAVALAASFAVLFVVSGFGRAARVDADVREALELRG
jgi:Na+/proline symporter